MRKTPPISQIFYSNNWFIKGSLKQQVETDPQRSMCSCSPGISGHIHIKPFSPPFKGAASRSHRNTSAQPTYKHRGRKMHLSWLASGHPHIQITNSHLGLALQMCGCHIWVQMFFTSNAFICHTQLRDSKLVFYKHRN